MDSHYQAQAEYFDHFIGDYSNPTLADDISRAEIEHFLDFCRLPMDKIHKVLELGTGNGRHTLFMLNKGFEVTATDISQKSLDILYKKAKELGLEKRLTVVNHDLEEPLYHGEYDLVFCIDVLHHTKSMKKVFASMSAAAKPGGWVAIFEPNALNPLFYLFFALKKNWKYEKGILRCTKWGLDRLFKENQLAPVRYGVYTIIPFFLQIVFPLLRPINKWLERVPLINSFCCFHFFVAQKK